LDRIQWLRVGAGLGVALIVVAIGSEAWLDYRSPPAPDAASGKTVEIHERGGNIYVTPTEFTLNRTAYGAGAVLVVGSILGFLWISRRR
jgi:hypothetical protein